ncbi:TolC family protein [Fulvivirga sedimenti]|uniref:TolC family protein n=1 Tax=Fulvivirga sedimenti TaxID=2879465 RepID=A0A9X1HQW0_9BACT|nr:TolC family protein [Fulvivirga sedimenti]MCA6075308.1 TolC family protein [Fulvivirga sedimenti]MCA6076485.1 TolC family protein [Fulvivirga sedimenti]MCA6077613.1 TolC family protein [Fulvivirga sedimenti]
MNKKSIISFLLLSFILSLPSPGQTRYFNLEEIIQRAKEQSPSAKQAETRRENRYWQYRLYRSNYNPQLRLNGQAPDYNRDFFSNRQDDGTIVFQGREQINSFVNLGIEQPIPWTGGNVSVNSNLSHFKDLERDLTQFNTTLLNVRLVQPIFGFNSLKWDRKTEPLRYEESRREYVEEMEFISRQATQRFFSYLDAQINLQIAQFNLANNDTIYKIEMGRYNIGTTSKDKLLQVELQLLRSQQDVAQARLDLETSRLSLQTYIGLNDNIDIELILPTDIPNFDVTYPEALQYAQQNRSDYLAFERRRLEAEREVARARSQRFQTDLIASYGLNNAGTQIDGLYQDPNNQQRVNVAFNIPLIDWGRNKARMQTALANMRLNEYIISQDEQNFDQEILTQVRQFEVLRSQLEITRKSDEVAQERYEVAQNRYLIGKIDITNLNIALTEKDNAKRSYINALRAFWTAYFDLRRLTLFDFVEKELLYDQDAEVDEDQFKN